ncbi:hypothetical protein [Streptomyces sp. NRRL S-337]|uniref:hypothetical protein n=1 Tax=Streptomyces sp. NRRL S-337 TaxID=1463900 RepID=UPI0004CC5BB3|nr:hypothetical protein [Streptomyces sp. NRRL S-337]
MLPDAARPRTIPFGIANFTMIPISLLPLGREIVPTDQPFAARRACRAGAPVTRPDQRIRQWEGAS